MHLAQISQSFQKQSFRGNTFTTAFSFILSQGIFFRDRSHPSLIQFRSFIGSHESAIKAHVRGVAYRMGLHWRIKIRGYASNTFDLSIVLPRSFTDMAQKIIAVFTRVLQGWLSLLFHGATIVLCIPHWKRYFHRLSLNWFIPPTGT